MYAKLFCNNCYFCIFNFILVCFYYLNFILRRIDDKNQLLDIPLNYYLIGKLWCLNSFKNQELNASISNLNMTRIPSMPLKSNES